MKTLLAVLPLALSGQLPAPGAEQTAQTLPAESPRMTIIRFEDVAVRPRSGRVYDPCAEKTAPTLPAESPRKTVIEFEDDALVFEPLTIRLECFPDRRPHGDRRGVLVRVRENFDDKVMQSADEM